MVLFIVMEMFLFTFLFPRFAIYIPLFLPIGIPVLGSFYKALKWMKNKRKDKQD